ncbi:MAG: protein translocase subunit SecD [Spirochaetes bacterium]|nr:protein translocase subunit SecD [Spirochaetota bacterium]
MNRGMVYKGIFIFIIILFSIMLILPSVGTKKMEIILTSDASPQDIQSIMNRFPVDKFNVTKAEGKFIMQASGFKITDAVMNEVKTYNGVKDVKMLPHWAEKAILAKKVNFGLDLQGGMDLVMMANFDKIKKQYANEKYQLTEKKRTLETSLTDKGNTDKDAVNNEIKEIDYQLKDINDNKLHESGELRDHFKDEITQQALEMLRNRIDKFGVAEPSILQRGNEAIEIQLPGVKDPKAVKNIIGTTGSVQYRLVDDAYTLKAGGWLAANNKNKILPESADAQDALLSSIARDIKLPNNLESLFLYNRDEKTKKIFPADILVLQKAVALSGNDINKAYVGRDEYGSLIVQFTTTTEGASKFAKVTAQENKGKRLAIIIDNKIRSAPRINDPIVTGNAQITGDFTVDEVNALARIIQEGALPVDLTIVQETTVGPSLGQDSIEAMINAILVAIAGIFIFMFVYYKAAGLIANIGLILNTVFLFAILSWLGFTLTLPGIAGMILNIGMAVDSNIIIYERIKEELKSGKSVRMAISNGFDRAFWAIFDANLTTLIAAFVLFNYGTGPIKGFAVTLSVGIVATMFVALVITKYVFKVISLKKDIKMLSI